MICVDASLAAKWIFPEDFSDKALAMVTECAEIGERMVAPPLLSIEVTNIIRQRMLRNHLTLDEAKKLLEQFFGFATTIASPAGLSETALTLADAHNLPAVYDAHYLALAQLLGCDLWTDDQRLLRALGGKLTFVKWIGDYSTPANR